MSKIIRGVTLMQMAHQDTECFTIIEEGSDVFENDSGFWKIGNIANGIDQNSSIVDAEIHKISFV
jgi:hypothetical protein